MPLIEASPAFMELFIDLYLAGIVHGPPSFCAITTLAVTKAIAVQINTAMRIEVFMLD
jgi:hypothetical protein